MFGRVKGRLKSIQNLYLKRLKHYGMTEENVDVFS